VQVGVGNPFGHAVEVAATVVVRGGAFEVEGLPVELALGPFEERVLPVALAGGSWSPGDDPVLLARYKWSGGPGRAAGELLLDAPFERIRSVRLGRTALRLPLLCERPGDAPATMTVRLRRDELLASVESPGGLEEVRAHLRLGTRVSVGARGVRARLPEAFARDPRGVPFCVGFTGVDAEASERGRRLRRLAGGLPPGVASGAPARLFPIADA